ncbi:ATP-binding protein [Candidatus Nitrososphaera sp. FF02]|uniref:sensor histidine kinase n=1 Tax=Candidatus Nitrososphaera sp. FF02 TaxID=3398226 RepID=UPI0039EB654D
MEAIENVWDLRLQHAEALASNPDIRNFLAMPGAATEGPARESVEEFEALTTTRDTTFLAIRVTDIAGTVLIATDPAMEGSVVLGEDTVRRALLNSFYTVAFDADLGIAVLETVAPVYRPDSTLPAGFVTILREPYVANSILSNLLFLGDTGEIYLVDESGLMITDSRFVQGARYTQMVDSPPVQECFANGADVIGGLYTNYRGSQVYGASNCDRNLGIVLISEVDRDEMFSPLKMLQYQYLLIAGGIIAAAGASAFFLSHSILRPLFRLKATMGKVQAGYFEKVSIRRRDEIGELAASFNAMVEEIGIKSKKIHLKNDILSFMTSRLEVQADELKKADREKEEYSKMVVHELKTFLVPIIGYSELMLDGTLGELNQKQREKAVIMLERAWSLLYMTQNVLDARMLETKELRMNVAKEPIPAVALLDECLNRALPLARSRDIEITIMEPDMSLELLCDSGRVLQVLDNLVSNAIKATSAGSRSKAIRLRAENDHDDVLFSIKDSGKGIPQEMHASMFKKFYESDKSFTRQAGASGLGLAISKGIVEAHGGRMWFTSVPGLGSSFYFTLPKAGKKDRNAGWNSA